MEAWKEELYNSEFYNNEIMHHGIKGMHWGVRRYQNPDGSLTEAGRKHNGKLSESAEKRLTKAKEYSANHPTKIAKAGKKIKKAKIINNFNKDLDSYKKNESLGNKVVKNLLLGGPLGVSSYNNNRVAGSSRLGASLGRQLVSGLKALPTSALGSVAIVGMFGNGSFGKTTATAFTLANTYRVNRKDAIKRYDKMDETAKEKLRNKYS